MSTHPSVERNEQESAPVGPQPALWYWRIVAPLVALLGGLFGILGAAYTELVYGSILVAFVGAPIIEEVMKPAGVYLLLVKRPAVLRSQRYTAFLAGLGGLAFAVVENLVYLNLYIPDPSPTLVLWRYTVCIGIHTVCSFIAGHGINDKLLAAVRGEVKFLSFDKRFFVFAMVLHSLYNIFAVVAERKLGLGR